MTWHCNWSEDFDWFAERIEIVLGTKCLSVVVLVLGLMLRVLVAVVAVTLALRRTCASLDIRAEEEVAFMLENMDSWRQRINLLPTRKAARGSEALRPPENPTRFRPTWWWRPTVIDSIPADRATVVFFYQ